MFFSLGLGLVLGGGAGCAPVLEPDPCEAMCRAAAELYGSCLQDWGAGWESAGYDDEPDFLDSCETWAWEMRLLEEDALQQGVIDEKGQVEATCTERRAAFESDAATCSTYTSIDWNDAPWIEEPEEAE